MLNSKEYQDYIHHQKIKTSDPVKQTKWLTEEWEPKTKGFIEIFKTYVGAFDVNGKCVCLGSRTGQEVLALKTLGFEDSIGIDLIAFPPYTIEADFHDLPFENDSVSLIYTNAVDHVKEPQIWADEINRIIRKGGYILLNTQQGMHQDDYSVLDINNVQVDLIDKYFASWECKVNKPIPQNVHAMNWEVLLQK